MSEQDAPRTEEQNAKFHAMVRDISKQLTWAGHRWGEEDWKRILLAAKFGQHVIKSPLGFDVIVVNKMRSRDTTVEQMMEMIAEVEAFGAEHGVDWTDDES